MRLSGFRSSIIKLDLHLRSFASICGFEFCSCPFVISIHDPVSIEALRKRLRIDPHRLKRLRGAFYRRQLSAVQALDELPTETREAFASEIDFHPLELSERHDSKFDGASKLIFRTDTGQLIEAVILRIATGRTTLCISSQAGCAAACAFCATGKMGLGRNLTSGEICDQVIQANQILREEGRRIRNIVFMGMGEPLHNEENVYAAIDLLTAPDGFAFDEQRVLLSTVGVPEAFMRCAKRFPKLGLALSLHSAREPERLKIVPLTQRHSLSQLRTALEKITHNGRRVMIGYTLLAGINDTQADVAALRDYLKDLPVHLNLIPYNPIDAAPELRGTPKPQREAFAKALKEAGFKVTLRYSLGSDIAAACGQLVKERRKANASR